MQIIAGKFKGRVLKSPKGEKTRPTSSKLRGALFNRHQETIVGARVLDLFAGSGAVGLEALSRGAKKAFFVDNNRFAVDALKANVVLLGVEREIKIIQADVMVALKKIKGETFDFIYADPPYELTKGLKRPLKPIIGQLIEFFDNNDLLAPGGTLLIEEGGSFEPPRELFSLQPTDERVYGSTFLYEFVRS